jgi:TolB protein
MMPADDDLVLRRSWDELNADVKQRGRILRRRGRMARVGGAVAVVALIIGVAVALNRDDGTNHVQIVNPPAPELTQSVAFVRIFDGPEAKAGIFVVDPDSHDARQLTTDLGANDGSPAWSPDGQWIAFQSERNNPLRGIKRVTDIYLMRPDGSDVRRVTNTGKPGLGNGMRHPAWSPDGAQLAVAHEDEQDRSRIVVVNADGSQARTITDGTGDVGPVWSPDGSWIAFRRRPPQAANEELWLVRPDGGDAHRVLAKIHDAPISFTPEGLRIVFAAAAAPPAGVNLFTVALDGSAIRPLTHDAPGENLEPAWAAGGRLLVYRFDPDRQGNEPGTLVLATADGRRLRDLTTPEGASDYSPSLGPPAP